VPAEADAHATSRDGRMLQCLQTGLWTLPGHVLWVGATRKRGQDRGQATVEAILTQALQSLQNEVSAPDRAEDSVGRVQTSVETFAVFGGNKQAVKQAIVGES
jgi:hypothetical protein